MTVSMPMPSILKRKVLYQQSWELWGWLKYKDMFKNIYLKRRNTPKVNFKNSKGITAKITKFSRKFIRIRVAAILNGNISH